MSRNVRQHKIILSIVLLCALYFAQIGLRLTLHGQAPIDGILVLGGSIQREVYAIAQAKELPRPIVLSGGSSAGCIQRVVDYYGVDPAGIWIEPCANSTFENFAFAAPLLRAEKVHHVLVITSATHLLRAGYLGKIMLGLRGIAVQVFDVPEKGRPGNQESQLKTILDWTRGVVWGLFSPLLPPKRCPGLIALENLESPIVPDQCENHPLFRS